MTGKEYVEQQIAVGYDIHFNDGVWWIKVAPFFCMPVNPLQVIDCCEAKPKMHKSFLGYSYIVSDKQFANKYSSKLILNHEGLKNFTMESLTRERRKKVRKGLKLTEIKKIETIETVIDDMKEIWISTHLRTGYGKPREYYAKHYKKWRASIIKQFNVTKKERWGAFYNGSLIAFMNIIQIDDTIIIDNSASHTDHLDKCPNDALYFSILDHCKNLQDCEKVISGEWSNDAPSLNAFKQSYGFEKVDLPLYAKYNPLLRLAKRIISLGKTIKKKKLLNG